VGAGAFFRHYAAISVRIVAGERAAPSRKPGDFRATRSAAAATMDAMANKFDAAVLATNAEHLEAMAKSARSKMLSRTTEKATRLGADGERLDRQARAAESQSAEAEQLAATHLAEAARFDTKAGSLQQQAAAAAARGDYAGAQEATELGEEAAKAREGAAVARNKSKIAGDDAARLADEAAELRAQEHAIDAELADMGASLPVTELAVDHLEWHAEKARAMADTVRQADDLQAHAVAASARGDHAAAAELGRRASSLRDDADVLAFVRERPPFPIDHRALETIGVTVTPDDLAVPMPELIDPNSPMNPLADASDPGLGDEAIAGNAGSTEVDSSIGAIAWADDSSFDVAQVEAPSFDEPMGAEAFVSGFDDRSLGEPPVDHATIDADTGFTDDLLA
jgi:hypothetical protein